MSAIRMKITNTTACVIANGGSDCVGANALRAETFTKLCKGIRYWLQSKTFAAENDDERINRGAYEHEAAKQHSSFFHRTDWSAGIKIREEKQFGSIRAI